MRRRGVDEAAADDTGAEIGVLGDAAHVASDRDGDEIGGRAFDVIEDEQIAGRDFGEGRGGGGGAG